MVTIGVAEIAQFTYMVVPDNATPSGKARLAGKDDPTPLASPNDILSFRFAIPAIGQLSPLPDAQRQGQKAAGLIKDIRMMY